MTRQDLQFYHCLLLMVLAPCVKCLVSVETDCSGTQDSTRQISHQSEYWRESGIKFLHHVITSVGWTSIVIIAELSEETEKEVNTLLADDSLSVTVFQWSVSDHMTSRGDNTNGTLAAADNQSSGADDLYNSLLNDQLPSSAHVLLLGQWVFVSRALQQITQVKESTAVTFDWLTIIPRDKLDSLLKVAEGVDNMAIIIQEDTSSRLTVETTLRERDTTRLTRVTEWSPCTNPSPPALTKDELFPNHKYGLGGRTLKMVTMQWNPFMIRHQNGSITWYTGYCMDLLDILASQLNFTCLPDKSNSVCGTHKNPTSTEELLLTKFCSKVHFHRYVITEPSDENWGQQLSNGTWVGMTGMLHRKEVDFALSGMSITAARATVSDYSRGFYHDEIVMITINHDSSPVGWTFFTRPFHWSVFLLLGCGLALLTVLLTLIDRHFVLMGGDRSSQDRDGKTRVPLLSASLVQAAEVLFGSLLGRVVVYTGMSSSGRVLMCTWLLLSIVTVATYTGKLTSNSVVTKQPVPFKSLSELVTRTDYTWGFSKGTNLERIFRMSARQDYQQFYHKMLEFETRDPDVRSRDQKVINQKLLTGTYVRLTSETTYKYNKAEHCQLTLVQERLFHDTLATYLQKGSPYTSMFDDVIADATELGILDYLAKKWLPEHSSCYGDEAKVMPVSLELVPMAFLMAVAGMGLASVMLFLEFLTRDSKHDDHTTKSGPACMPGFWM